METVMVVGCTKPMGVMLLWQKLSIHLLTIHWSMAARQHSINSITRTLKWTSLKCSVPNHSTKSQDLGQNLTVCYLFHTLPLNWPSKVEPLQQWTAANLPVLGDRILLVSLTQTGLRSLCVTWKGSLSLTEVMQLASDLHNPKCDILVVFSLWHFMLLFLCVFPASTEKLVVWNQFYYCVYMHGRSHHVINYAPSVQWNVASDVKSYMMYKVGEIAIYNIISDSSGLD